MTLQINGERIGWSLWISFSTLMFVTLLWNIQGLYYVPDPDKCDLSELGVTAWIICLDKEYDKLGHAYYRHYVGIIINSVNGLGWVIAGNSKYKWVKIV